MGKTSNASKQKWSAQKYTQVKVAVLPEIAAAFKARCRADSVSMASEISRFMSGGYNENGPKKRPAFSTASRPQRRKALRLLILQMEAVMAAEQEYLEAIPENLRNSCRYDAAEQTISALIEALEILDNAYS
jgi:hypothetical protein